MVASTAPSTGSGLYADPREDWLALHTEEILDPSRPIVDPHHRKPLGLRIRAQQRRSQRPLAVA
jgi:hypothetical protein